MKRYIKSAQGINLLDYNPGYVLMQDGLPIAVFDYYQDARHALLCSRAADAYYPDLKDSHTYNLMYWDGTELRDTGIAQN